MQRKKWVISDTHFQHANVLNFTDDQGNKVRPGFDSVQDMDDYMIQMWNQTVAPNDYVYHLGDVMFGNKASGLKIIDKLNGQKRLILGNHDCIRTLSGKNDNGNWIFKKVDIWKVMGDRGIIFSHVPLHQDTLFRGDPTKSRRLINVHGHIHQNDAAPDFYINVCVEKTGYTPVDLDMLTDVARQMQKKNG